MAEQEKTKRQTKITDLLSADFMARLDSLDIASKRVLRGALHGERRSKRRGQSVEFADHRPYVSGDDLRFIDWNIYGRLDQLFLKLFLEEQDLTVHVVVDVSASQAFGEPSKEMYIKKLAAALCYISMVNNNRVNLTAFADGIVGQFKNMRGRGYLRQMTEFLLSTPCEGASDFEAAATQLATGRMGSGIVIVLSDFFFKEGFELGLKRLATKNYDLYAMQVLSPQEIEPDMTGDLKLVDLEDSDTAEITISGALMKYYKKNLTAYCNDIKDFCTRRGGTYVLANTSSPVERLVLNYLRRIKLVR